MNRWAWKQQKPTSDDKNPGNRSILIMGILNATPDSFSGDGRIHSGELIAHGLSMIEDGADILDIGGESSRPFSAPLDAGEEMRRVLPVIRELRRLSSIPLSIDTRHVDTARAALDEGADIVNDITGMADPEMRSLAIETDASVVIMHMQGTPGDMQRMPVYDNVVLEVAEFLQLQTQKLISEGMDPDRIAVDPGIGFGKTLEHNLELIRNLDRLRVGNCPVLLGVSRKSMVGTMLGTPVEQRLEGSLAAAAAGVCRGADILRVHDVAETRKFFKIFLQSIGDRRI